MASPPGHQVDRSSQIIFSTVNLLGLSIISFCLGRRTPRGRLPILKAFNSLSLARLAVLAIFVDSWIFLFSSGLLTNGIGLGAGPSTCAAAIFLCIVFYVSSKLFIYVFLAERVYIVWSAGSSVSRRNCHAYRICLILIAIYVFILVLMVAGRITDYTIETGRCVIGLARFASIPLLSYDLLLNVIATLLFVIPLFRDKVIQKDLKGIAVRTLLGSAISLTTSSVNFLIMAILHGRELGWICLACCSADVAVNAIAVFWVTSSLPDARIGRERTNHVSFTPPHLSISVSNPDAIWPVISHEEHEMSDNKPSDSAFSAEDDSKRVHIQGGPSTGETHRFDIDTLRLQRLNTTIYITPPSNALRYDHRSPRGRGPIQSLPSVQNLRSMDSESSLLLRSASTSSWPPPPQLLTRISSTLSLHSDFQSQPEFKNNPNQPP